MSDEEFEVEAIMEMRINKKKKPIYLVRWKGYGAEGDSWEPEENLTNCTDLLRKYREMNEMRFLPVKTSRLQRSPKSPKSARKLTASSPSTKIENIMKAIEKDDEERVMKPPPLLDEAIISRKSLKMPYDKPQLKNSQVKPMDMCNGMTTVAHSAVAELVKSSLDISPMSLKEKVGRYPTIKEIREYATQKSIQKVMTGEEMSDDEIDTVVVDHKQRSWGKYIVALSLIVCLLAAMWGVLMWVVGFHN